MCVPSPPLATLISSTYSISAMASSRPIYSYSVPPNSLVMLYFPSEKAPAPPKPFIMAQEGHLMQLFTFTPSMGQWRLSSARPASSMAIFAVGHFCTSSYAAKIPPGPPPIINTSYFMMVFLRSIVFSNTILYYIKYTSVSQVIFTYGRYGLRFKLFSLARRCRS